MPSISAHRKFTPCTSVIKNNHANNSISGNKKDATCLSGRIVSINQSFRTCHHSPATAAPGTALIVCDGEKLSRTVICELLTSATQHTSNAIKNRLQSLCARLENTGNDTHLTPSEEKSLLKDLYKIRTMIPDGKKDKVANAIYHLEKVVYSCLLNDTLNTYSKVYKQDITLFSNPGTAHNKNITASLQMNAGCSISNSITAIKATAQLGYTRTYTTDTDDEGIVGSTKEDKLQGSLSVDSNIICTDQITLQAGGEVTARKTVAHGVNYGGGTHEYFKEKLSHKLFTYKNKGIKDKLFAQKHSLKHHQQVAQNNQSLLAESWSTLTGKQVESKSPLPFQAAKTPKRIFGQGYTANVKASAQFSSLANAGAKIQYEFNKNEIEVNPMINIFNHVNSGNITKKQLANLHQVSKEHSKAFAAVFTKSHQLHDKTIDSKLSNADILHAVNALDETVSEYTKDLQRYSAGVPSAGKTKHAIEKQWGVKQSGRYGFLQCAEIILATLSSRLDVHSADEQALSEIRERMSLLNDKIVNPEFKHNKLKLQPLVSFNNLINISNHSHIVTAELNAQLGNNSVSGGGKVSIAVVAKHVSNPYRIRAGEHRDIEITVGANVTLANVLDNLTDKFAKEAGVALSELRSAVSAAFSSSTNVSQGMKIVVRYFSPDWSNSDNSKRNYSHQVTSLQLLTDATLSAKVTSPAAVVGGGISAGAGISNTNVVAVKIGTDTLNYLMLRYNYLANKPEEQPVWQRLIDDNRNNLQVLMKNMLTAGTNSSHELELLIREKIAATPDAEQSKIWDEYHQIRKDILSVRDDENNFQKGLDGLITLMKWHEETTNKISATALQPGNIAKMKKNIMQRALSSLTK